MEIVFGTYVCAFVGVHFYSYFPLVNNVVTKYPKKRPPSMSHFPLTVRNRFSKSKRLLFCDWPTGMIFFEIRNLNRLQLFGSFITDERNALFSCSIKTNAALYYISIRSRNHLLRIVIFIFSKQMHLIAMQGISPIHHLCIIHPTFPVLAKVRYDQILVHRH